MYKKLVFKIYLKKILLGLSLAVFIFLLFWGYYIKTHAAATSCYWVGDTSPALWNDANHWSDTPGGSGNSCDGGGVVPGSDDIAIFTSDNTNNVTLDTSPNIAGLTNAGGYNGTLNMSGNSLTVTGDLTFKAGNITAGAGTLNISGNFDLSGTSYSYDTQAVTLSGSAKTLDIGSNTLYDLIVDGSISLVNSDAAINHSLTVNLADTLTLTSGLKMSLADNAQTSISGLITGDGVLELVKYACKNLDSGGTLEADVRCVLQDNPNDNTMTARTFGGDFEIYNNTGGVQRFAFSNGDLEIFGDLNISEVSGTIQLYTSDGSGLLNSFTVHGDMSFLGNQIGGIFYANSETALYTFSGNVDMNTAEWRSGMDCQTETSVVFDGDNKAFMGEILPAMELLI